MSDKVLPFEEAMKQGKNECVAPNYTVIESSKEFKKVIREEIPDEIWKASAENDDILEPYKTEVDQKIMTEAAEAGLYIIYWGPTVWFMEVVKIRYENGEEDYRCVRFEVPSLVGTGYIMAYSYAMSFKFIKACSAKYIKVN